MAFISLIIDSKLAINQWQMLSVISSPAMSTAELWEYTKIASLWRKACVTKFNTRNATAHGGVLAVSVTYFLCVIALSNVTENSNSPNYLCAKKNQP